MRRRSPSLSVLGSAAAAAAFAAMLVAGCEGDDTTAAPLDEREAFARNLAAIICEQVEPCCVEQNLDAPTAECTYSMRTDAFIAMLNAEKERREVLLEEKQSCLDRYKATKDVCGELTLAADLVVACPEMFGPIPEGDKGPGELCEGTFECGSPPEGDRLCYRRDFNELLHCVWIVPFEIGAECSLDPSIIAQCPAGYTCGPPADGTPGTPVCRKPSAFGQACFTFDGCAEGFVCAEDKIAGGSSCVVPLGEGDLCFDTPDQCGRDLYCDPNTAVCDILPILQACQAGNCETDYDRICL